MQTSNYFVSPPRRNCKRTSWTGNFKREGAFGRVWFLICRINPGGPKESFDASTKLKAQKIDSQGSVQNTHTNLALPFK